jgi:hypothetical protein
MSGQPPPALTRRERRVPPQIYLPDVGKTPAAYQLRFTRRADGAVVEVRCKPCSTVTMGYESSVAIP